MRARRFHIAVHAANDCAILLATARPVIITREMQGIIVGLA